MEFDLSDDLELFRDTTHRFLETQSPLTTVREWSNVPAGYELGWWQQGAQLGWTSLLVPEHLGGGSVSGDSVRDLAVLAEEMGRLVAPGPLLPVNVVAATLAAHQPDEERQQIITGLVNGESVAAWCLAEPGEPWSPEPVAVRAERKGVDFVLTGTKSPVEAAAQSSHLLVTARSDDGPVQLLVPTSAAGVTVTPLHSLDMVRRFATVHFDDVELSPSALVGDVPATADIQRQLAIALVVQCAETVGATNQVFEFTLEYAFNRYTFGRSLASYQALKHRFADMKMWLESSMATTEAAVRALDHDDPDVARRVSIAKAYVGDRCPEIIQDCVQMHGGIGVTWEHDIHLYLRRAIVNSVSYGSPMDHLNTIALLSDPHGRP